MMMTNGQHQHRNWGIPRVELEAVAVVLETERRYAAEERAVRRTIERARYRRYQQRAARGRCVFCLTPTPALWTVCGHPQCRAAWTRLPIAVQDALFDITDERVRRT